MMNLVADAPVDGPYELEMAHGEHLSETVWFRAANQVGITVDSWGDWLLVVGASAASPQHPDGGAMMVLTTYGLSDDILRRIESDWSRWWS